MGESLNERHRVQDEGLRVVNCGSMGTNASHKAEMLKVKLKKQKSKMKVKSLKVQKLLNFEFHF